MAELTSVVLRRKIVRLFIQPKYNRTRIGRNEAPDGNPEAGVRGLEPIVSLHLMVAPKPGPPGAR